MSKTIIRFKSSEVASEMADILQGKWDGGTGVIIEKGFDRKALEVALELTGNQKDDYTIENQQLLIVYDELSPESFGITQEELNESIRLYRQQTCLTSDEFLELIEQLNPSS